MKTFVWRLLPWRTQQLLSWCWGNRFLPAVIWQRFRGNTEHRIMVSTAFFGGVGGTEKHLKALIEGMPEAAFDIRATQTKPFGFLPSTKNYTLNCCADRGATYDLYIYFAGGGKPKMELNDYTFRKSLVDTNGADIRDIEGLFDKIAIQTGNYGRYCDEAEKTILAFPAVRPFFPRERVAVDLPPKFFLTVFNPFSRELKGNDQILRMAEVAAFPIVWCFSDRSGWDFSEMPDHPNLIKRKNLSQEELYYAYDHATAYISFSHVESFGWSLAEAFYSNLPIITKEVGFISYVKEQPGIYLYDTEQQLEELLSQSDYRAAEYSDEVFVQNAFPKVIRRLLQ